MTKFQLPMIVNDETAANLVDFLREFYAATYINYGSKVLNLDYVLTNTQKCEVYGMVYAFLYANGHTHQELTDSITTL